MKKQVEKLDEEADMMEAYASSPEKQESPQKDEEGKPRKVKAKKTRMCAVQLEKGRCQRAECQFAHNPIELDLIPVETKMKNLNGVIMSQSIKLKNMKPLEPWRPAKSGDIEHTHLMDMASKKRRGRSGEGGEDEEEGEEGKRKEKMKKSIFDRENIFKKPYEANE